MFKIIYIFLILFGFYYIFSGINEPFFLVTGMISAFLGVYVAVKMGVLRLPGLSFKILGYWVWLFKEVIISTIGVLKYVWGLKQTDPGIIHVKTLQKNETGLTLYGNSITLTPGTVCVYVDEKTSTLTVHSLTESTREDIKSGDMDRRVLEIVDK